MKKVYLLLTISCLLFSLPSFSQSGSALNFDGTDDEVNCGNNAAVQISGTAITLEARVFIDVFDAAGVFGDNIINKLDTGANGYALRVGGAGAGNLILGSGGAWTEFNTPNNALSVGVWHHLAATYDGTTMRLYVDGVEVATNATTISFTDSSGPLRLGESAFAGRHMNGSLDEVRIWNVVRTPTELIDNMETELTLPQTGLAAYYKFNQGIANADNSAETTLIDELGTSNGTLTNFTLDGTASNWVDGGILLLNVQSFDPDNKSSVISAYPNPVKSNIRIGGLVEATDYEIYNLVGQKVLSGNVFENDINVETLDKGVYMIALNTIGSVKFVKN